MTTKEAAIKLGTLQELAIVALRECCHVTCGLGHKWTDGEIEKVGEYLRNGGRK